MHGFIRNVFERINRSINYQNIKSFFRSLLEDSAYPYKKYFDFFMIALIVISISTLIMSKSGRIPEWVIEFDLYFITAIFALEYLLRIWIQEERYQDRIRASKAEGYKRYLPLLNSKLRYMLSLPALIHLIAIFPQFRIIRLLKLYHYMHGASSLFNALLKKRFEFIFLGYILLGVTFTFGSIFYLLEFGINEALHSYLDAIYWALVTISTVGYGDISPVTQMGKIVSMFGIIFGIAMISFVTSVMVSAFSERFDELRNQDSINHVRKMNNVIVINGYGHLGNSIGKKLKVDKRYEPVIIESDEDKANRALRDGYKVIHAESSSAKLVKTLYQHNNIVAMLTLRSSDIDNIYFILNAKSTQENSVVYSRMNQVELQAQYEATKVDGLVEPYDVVDIKAFHYLKKHRQEENKNIFIFGYTHKSSQICLKLKKEGIDITIYEFHKTRYNEAKNSGFTNVILIDKKSTQAPEINDAIAVCAMDEESLNVYYTITLRANGFTGEIIALSDTKEDNRKLILAGVSKIFDMYDESAAQFVKMIEMNANIEMKKKKDKLR
ncbi:MAG: NAD-binding protein [Campylobacterota bacterium]|nr:NAD-binding protein [Campylobacterota bacterium]